MDVRITLEIPEMTLEAYAKKTGASLNTVRGWVKTGKLPTTKVGKRRMVNMMARVKDCLAQSSYGHENITLIIAPEKKQQDLV